jgi:hypothetical protein
MSQPLRDRGMRWGALLAWMARMAWMTLPMALLLSGCASVAPRVLTPVDPAPPPYDIWARVLERHVDDQGRVDFAALASDGGDLARFVNHVAQVAPASHPALFPDRPSVLAYHLNAYNALAMQHVLDSGSPQTLAGFRKLGFFVIDKVTVGGQRLSLSDYENKVIRALGDARLHFGLNCMSVGCPSLPREPFLPATVDAQLDREARLFFDDPRHAWQDDTARVLWLSEILKFYTADFLAEAPSLAAYVNRYRTRPVALDYEVRFIDYDWTIKRQPAR